MMEEVVLVLHGLSFKACLMQAIIVHTSYPSGLCHVHLLSLRVCGHCGNTEETSQQLSCH